MTSDGTPHPHPLVHRLPVHISTGSIPVCACPVAGGEIKISKKKGDRKETDKRVV
jgi:hypothetical protein